MSAKETMRVELHEHGVVVFGFIPMSSDAFMFWIQALEGMLMVGKRDKTASVLHSGICRHFDANMVMCPSAEASDLWAKELGITK